MVINIHKPLICFYLDLIQIKVFTHLYDTSCGKYFINCKESNLTLII